MDKNVSLCIVLFVMTVVIATVASFGSFDNNNVGGFGSGDYIDRKYQSWLDKRGLGQSSFGGFGRTPTKDYRYFDWRDFLANGRITKRQLNYGPRSFGNFQRYFSNGLQDWRNTYYTGVKRREAPEESQPSA